MSDAYRDAGIGMLRVQIDEERAAIAKLDAEIGAFGRSILAKEVLEQIGDLRRQAFRFYRTVDDAREILEQTRALRERCEEALAAKRALLAIPEGFVEPPPPGLEQGPESELLRSELAETLGRIPMATVDVWGHGAVARALQDGIAITFAVEVKPAVGVFRVPDPRYRIWVGTPMPARLSVTIRREGILSTVGQGLGMLADVELADGRFDDLFVVDGEAFIAKALVVADVRLHLCRLAKQGVQLRIGDGLAALTWSSPGDEPFVESGHVAIFAGIRRALAAV